MMASPVLIPRMTPRLQAENENHFYIDLAKHTLAKVFSRNTFSQELPPLPFLTSIFPSELPGKVSFLFLAKFRTGAFKFFFEMISHRLIPGQSLNAVCVNTFDFDFPEISNDVYTVCEIIVEVKNDGQYQQILSHLPSFETEIKLGLESSYYARQILELKGLAIDEKTATIHEHISHWMKRLPQKINPDILSEMQHLLVLCKNEFKVSRTSRHLSRIIGIQYLFRNELRKLTKESPKQRHFLLKLFKTKIYRGNKEEPVLSLLVGFNYLREKEALEKEQLLEAIQMHIPEAIFVDNSFFSDHRSMESIGTLYFELQKSNGEVFSIDEIRLLAESLPKDLRDRIEYVMHPVFMPCNEEEIMRNILTLANEIRYLRDIPQLVLTFDEQTPAHLVFMVILVRLVLPGALSIKDLFEKNHSTLEYIHDRTKLMSCLRKKYTKEATVFRVRLQKEDFLRRDHSIDLYKARHYIVNELSNSIGGFRDFNGGMIMKQNELLDAFKELLDGETKYNELLLENFFFSLMPVSMRTLLEPEALKILFLMLNNAIEHGFPSGVNHRIRQDLNFIFILIQIESTKQQEELHKSLLRFSVQSTELAQVSITFDEITYAGYIYHCTDSKKQTFFLKTIQEAIHPIIIN